MDLDFAGKIEGNANTLALDARDTHNTDRVLGIPDDDFFTFSTSYNQHPLLLHKRGPALHWQVPEYTTAGLLSKENVITRPKPGNYIIYSPLL